MNTHITKLLGLTASVVLVAGATSFAQTVPAAFQGSVRLSNPKSGSISFIGAGTLTGNFATLTVSGTFSQGSSAKPSTANSTASSTIKKTTVNNASIIRQTLNERGQSSQKTSGYVLYYVRPNLAEGGGPVAAELWIAKRSSAGFEEYQVPNDVLDLFVDWTDNGGYEGAFAGVFSGTASLTASPTTLQVSPSSKSSVRLTGLTRYNATISPVLNGGTINVSGVGSFTENNKGVTGSANVAGTVNNYTPAP